MNDTIRYTVSSKTIVEKETTQGGRGELHITLWIWKNFQISWYTRISLNTQKNEYAQQNIRSKRPFILRFKAFDPIKLEEPC